MVLVELVKIHGLTTALAADAAAANTTTTPAKIRGLGLRALLLAATIEEGLWTHAVDPTTKRIAYEVDGFGSRLYMDDANIPSLLSLPYLGLLDLPNHRYKPLLSLPATNEPPSAAAASAPSAVAAAVAEAGDNLSSRLRWEPSSSPSFSGVVCFAPLLRRLKSQAESFEGGVEGVEEGVVGAGAYDWAAAYAATRPLLLDPSSNPWFFRQGQEQEPEQVVAEGIGGPHVGWGFVWPMSVAVRALTALQLQLQLQLQLPQEPREKGSTVSSHFVSSEKEKATFDSAPTNTPAATAAAVSAAAKKEESFASIGSGDYDDEVLACLSLLSASSAGTGFLHESFNVNDVNEFTRPWFAWVNTLFGDLIITLIEQRPDLILKS